MNKLIWTIIRIAALILVGLMNTVFIRTEDISSWKNYVGYLFLITALVDSFFLVKNIIQKKKII